MSVILDVIVAAILVFFIAGGIKKGGARGILELLSFVITIIAVMLFKNTVTDILLGLEPVQGWIANMTAFFTEQTENAKLLFFLTSSSPADAATELVAFIMNIFGFVATYFVVKLVFRLFMGITDKIMSLPLLKSANRLVGGIIGGVKGCVVIWLLMALLLLFAASNFFIEFNSAVADSYLTKMLYNNNILFTLFK